MKSPYLKLYLQGWYKAVMLSFFFLFYGLTCNAQLPEYLELYNPKIQGQCIASGGRVWSKMTHKIIFSVGYQTALTSSSLFYSDGINTFIHSNIDGHFITQVPGNNYIYNPFKAMIWNYSENQFKCYTEYGQSIIALSFLGNSIYPYNSEVRYLRNNSVYKYGFTNSTEQLLGSFEGTFSTWFLDGEYFLTTQGSVVRVYDKNSTLIKLVDMPSTENLGGSNGYFWTYPSVGSEYDPLLLHKTNENTVYSYPTGTNAKTFATSKNIAIFHYGFSAFSIISLSDSQPHLTTHHGAGPYLESYDSDISGNWVTANKSGVIGYGSLISDHKLLNLGRIRSMSSDGNNNLVISSSSGHVLLYKFRDSLIVNIDTFKINAAKAELSVDGKYLAASGNTFDSQYSEDELSLYVYDVESRALVRKWYYNFFRDNSSYLEDFNFSNDGKFISQKISKWNGSTWSYFSFLSDISSEDSVFINSTDNHGAPLISSAGSFITTSIISSLFDPGAQDICKLYEAKGMLLNAFTGFASGWISDTQFVLNRLDSAKCRGSICTKYYSPHIYSIDGQEDKVFEIPDSINNGMLTIKTQVLDAAKRISNKELYVNNSNVIDISNGRLLFSFDTIPSLSTPIGTDYIVYIKDNSLQIINWRSLSRKVWYRDADGDGFGNPSITKVFFKKSKGFVDNSGDCNDLDSTINPNTKWYKDEDGDGFGDPLVFATSCTQTPGYVKNNTDCDDNNKELTPLNSCLITALETRVSDFCIFPNPSTGMYYLRSNSNSSQIKIINSCGQVINPEITKDGEFYIINMNKEAVGLYIMNVEVGKSESYIKIIKY